MSGIAVIWNRDGRPVDGAQIVRMTELMKHRGPDGERHWHRGPVAIGHCALNTTPEALADQQPLLDEAAGLSITFDGRIDNREELKTLLDIDGSDPVSVSDPRLVLAAYRKWGEACPEHLLGDFAFAVWDERQQRLFCARDFLGVRPLFYALVGTTFVCASEVEALFALPGLRQEPNLAVVAARLLRQCIEFDDTLYMGAWRLPLSHCLTVTQDAVRRRRYWDIDPSRQTRYRTDDQYAEHFRELFFDAVSCRMRSSAPIAGLLSGGLDSSGIVCSVQQIRKEREIIQPNFETFSMVFDRVVSSDERPFIDAVVRHCGAKANFHIGDRNPTEAAIARSAVYPGLLYSPQTMVLGEMFKHIKARGFSVVLDGNGGDELAGDGFRHLIDLMRWGRWLSLSALVRAYAENYTMSSWWLFFNHVLRPALPPSIKRFYRRLIPRDDENNPRTNLVSEDALVRSGARERIEHPAQLPAFQALEHAQMYQAIFTGWGPMVVSEGYELLVSYAGIEMRQPFRDRRLVELALSLPADQLWRQGWSRFVYRNAMKGILPEEVQLRRGKGEFSHIFYSVLGGSQAAEVRALFDDPILARLGVLDAQAARNLVRDYQNAPQTGDSRAVSEVLALEIACRQILGEPIDKALFGRAGSNRNAAQSGSSGI
jgi:asparagine synthase (glutamine-hydrolysing)